MIPLLSAVPTIVLSGCVALVVAALAASVTLYLNTRRVASHLKALNQMLAPFGAGGRSRNHDGISLTTLEEIRTHSEKLEADPQSWWTELDSHIELYTSPEEVEGWFLVQKPREVLPYDEVVRKRFHAAFFNAIPGLLTGAGLTLTFLAILIALFDVRFDKSNAAEPITGIDSLINGLSGKFLSSIVALVLSIAFTLFEKARVRGLKTRYESTLKCVSQAIPYLSHSRILLDIQRFAAKQTVSVSHISSEVVDRLIGSFNRDVVPALTDGMSAGVAEKMQDGLLPTMLQMGDTLDGLKSAIVNLEAQKQESVAGEIRALLSSLENSLVEALSKMGSDFHSALTGAAGEEFGNVQGTLEATRRMLSDMNIQFSTMQAAFATIIEKAEESKSDQMRMGREQSEAFTALMNGLMIKMQESADQNLGNVRSQLTMVVSDLSERVGSLSQDMMAAAGKVAKQAQDSASQVLEQTGEWSEATAKRLEALLTNIEVRSTEFETAGQSLMSARDFLVEVIAQNRVALERMAEASRQVQAYSTGLAGQTDALKGISQLQSQVASQFREVSGTLKSSVDQNEKLLAEYRRAFDGYKAVIGELDTSLAKILTAIQAGLRDYNQSIENNFKEIVKISNPLIAEASNLLHVQIEELSGQLEELGTVISGSVEKLSGRAKQH